MKTLRKILIVSTIIGTKCVAFDFGAFINAVKEVAKPIEQQRTLSNEDKQLLDLLVITKTANDQFTGNQSVFIKDIEGKFVLNRKNGYVQLNNCFTNDIKDVYNSASRELYEMLPQNQDLLAINTMYKGYGLPHISTIASAKVKDLLNNSGLEISNKCKENTLTDLSFISANSSDISVIPRYLLPYVLKTNDFASMQSHELLSVIPFDEQKKYSDLISKKLLERQQLEFQTVENYNELAKNKSKDFVGSLIISFNEYGDKKQALCSQNYIKDDAINVIGYRNLKYDFLFDDMNDTFLEKRLLLEDNGNLFDEAFEDLNSAYLKIKNNVNSCNIYVDYPYNIQLLKNALARDNIQAVYGKLLKSADLQEKHVRSYGYVSKAEYEFGEKNNASLEQIKFLREFNASNEENYNRYKDEMVKSKYSDKVNDLGVVSWFIFDKINGEKKKITPIAEREARIEAEKKAEKDENTRIKKENAEFVKNYPYEAILSCGFNGRHTTLAACLSGGQYGVDTEFELSNGGQYGLYKAYQVNQLGRETAQGLVLPLKKDFKIKVQNSSSDLILALVIKVKATEKILYQKSVSKYGVIYFQK